MKTIIIDTNILYEILIEESNTQMIFEHNINSHNFIINIHIIDEVVTLLRSRSKDHIVMRMIDTLIEERIFKIQPISYKEIGKAVKILKKYKDKKLSFTDCIILGQAKENDYIVWTHDKEMQKIKNMNFFTENQ